LNCTLAASAHLECFKTHADGITTVLSVHLYMSLSMSNLFI